MAMEAKSSVSLKLLLHHKFCGSAHRSWLCSGTEEGPAEEDVDEVGGAAAIE
jgi:hypothetical protein